MLRDGSVAKNITALPEDLSSVPSIHVWQMPVIPAPRGSHALFDPTKVDICTGVCRHKIQRTRTPNLDCCVLLMLNWKGIALVVQDDTSLETMIRACAGPPG